MRMQREGRGEREARLLGGAVAEQDLGEMQHRGEVARLELERATDVVQALGIAAEQVVERGALVPGLGELRGAAQQDREPRLGDVVALGGDVARRGVEGSGGGAVRMVHPRAPNAVLGLVRFAAGAAAQATEELHQRWQVAGGAPLAPAGDESEDLDLSAGHPWMILMEIARRRFERPEELAVIH